MALLGQTYIDIADALKRTDPDNKIAIIIELLAQNNDFINDMITLEGNLPTGHRTTMRSGLPSVSFREMYGFTQPTKSRTVQVDETTAQIEAFSFLDELLASLNNNVAALRLSEDQAFFEAMNQQVITTSFYGNTDTDPEQYLGLAPRFSDTTADNGNQIIDAGGTGSDNTSMWLLKWGERFTHGIFPKGTTAGLEHNDFGKHVETDAAGGKRVGWLSQYKWLLGLVVRDFRHVVRIANIDVSALETIGTGTDDVSANLINFMIRALYDRLENRKGGNLVWYCHRKVYTALTEKAQEKGNVNLTFETFGGTDRILQFHGVPIREVELLLTEAQVT